MYKKIYKAFHGHYHRRYHGVYQHARQLFVFDLILLFSACVLFGASLFLFFYKPGIADQIQLTLSLGDARIRSGDSVHLTAEYANHSKLKLTNTVLGIRLPPGFIVDRARTPESEFSNQSTFTLDELSPGGSGVRAVYGWFWAEPDSDVNFLGILSYVPEGKKDREQKLGSFLARLPESVLTAELIAVTSSFPSATLPITYRLQNTGERALENIMIEKNWVFESSAATATRPMTPGETREIKGTIKTPAKESDLVLYASPQIPVGNRLIRQGRQEQIVKIVYPELTAAARIVDGPKYVEPGQTLPTEISWHNNSRYSLGPLRLILTPTPGTVDLQKTARASRLKIENGQLIIDSSARTALADGRPGSRDSFTIPVYTLPALTAPEGAKFRLTPIIEASLPEIPNQTFSAIGSPAELPLATELKLTAEARYYTEEGDQLGRGPLPPRVGETTKYWILAQIYNTTNPVREARFTAELPAGVSFTGKQSVTIGPPLAFNEAARQVSWSYPELPPNSQTGLYFEVAVTPAVEQMGKTITLARSLRFTAADDIVNKPFVLQKAEITNLLPSADRGRVMGSEVVAE